MSYTSLKLCRELLELSGWDNNNGTPPDDRVNVWVQSYHTSSMGQGHPDYHTTPPKKRNEVVVGDWKVDDDPRFHVYVPEVVFEWWWDDVQKIKAAAIPAYDIAYLLKKLPKKFVRAKNIYGFVLTSSTSDGCFIADYISWTWQGPMPHHGKEHWLHNGDKAKLTEDNNPADAVAKLAIQLFKLGVLKKT